MFGEFDDDGFDAVLFGLVVVAAHPSFVGAYPDWVDQASARAHLGIPAGALFSTLGRTAARGLETIAIGQAILAFPIVTAITASIIENIDSDLKLTLISLGAGKKDILFTCLWEVRYGILAAAVTAFLIVIIFGNWFIGTMKRMQIGQVVRDDGPETHIYKQGVPTMGGLLILAAVIGSSFFWARLDNGYVWLTMLVTAFFGFIGAIDDYKKISQKTSAGLSARGKLLLQLAGATAVGIYIFMALRVEVRLTRAFPGS